MNKKETLIQLLRQQISYAQSLNGKLGLAIQNEKHEALVAANSTLSLLEKRYGLDPKKVLVSLNI